MNSQARKPSLSVPDFCQIEEIDRATFHEWLNEGSAPLIYTAGNAIRIYLEDYLDWKFDMMTFVIDSLEKDLLLQRAQGSSSSSSAKKSEHLKLVSSDSGL